jgi:hypothetical protein
MNTDEHGAFMTEREAIIAAYRLAAKQNVRGALATVVRV